jgi:hypothetical protein
MGPTEGIFEAWFEALERRHLAERTFAEVRRSVQALSSLYVERRGRLAEGAALDGAGKRAAFALFFGPLHFLAVREIVRVLRDDRPAPTEILDLGCGTGASGAAWAIERGKTPFLAGVDRIAWAAEEARWTYEALGVRGRARRGDLLSAALPGGSGALLAAFTVNELDTASRAALLEKILVAARTGARALIVEPISRRAAPWWPSWSAAFGAVGGIEKEWRFKVELPARLRLLDKAAGLDHRELTARSLWLG